MSQTLVFLDTETTGLDPTTCSIFQLSGVIRKNGQEETFDFRLHPYRGETISEEASEKTGITALELSTYPDQKETYNAFISLLDKYEVGKSFKDKAYLIGYNSSFDLDFLRSWFEFNDDKKFGYRFWWPDLDVAKLAAMYLVGERANLKNFQLTTVYKYIFKEGFEDAHNSLADVLATKRLFNFLSSKMLASLIQEKTESKIPVRQIKPKE